jgi:hypothetical protein
MVSMLAGDAMFPKDGEDADGLLAAADARIFELRSQRYEGLSACPAEAPGNAPTGAWLQ